MSHHKARDFGAGSYETGHLLPKGTFLAPFGTSNNANHPPSLFVDRLACKTDYSGSATQFWRSVVFLWGRWLKPAVIGLRAGGFCGLSAFHEAPSEISRLAKRKPCCRM
jgi:hypothetical protein